MRQKPIRLLVAFTLLASQTGCASLVGESMFVGEQEGRFLLSADAEGIRAFSDGLTGIAQVSKDSPDLKGAYWQKRESENQTQALKWQFKTRGGRHE